MSTNTQYNPNAELNARLLAAGASKTVYALITPETESVKERVLGSNMGYGFKDNNRRQYLQQFRDAWTGKQDHYHEDFFQTWIEWSKPVIDFNPALFPYYYPTAGASEALRHLIYDFAIKGGKTIHVFEGEYEGYKAMAEAARLAVVEHPRSIIPSVGSQFFYDGIFIISQPSAIDGNVWQDFNQFIQQMPDHSVIVDLTYVGAVPPAAIKQKFDITDSSIRNVVFSLSKPFGTYYDRIGGVFSREEDLGLFGNRWFKNLTSLAIGTALMKQFKVFDFPEFYGTTQTNALAEVSEKLNLTNCQPCDVFILASGGQTDTNLSDYLSRAGKLRLCLTPKMAEMIGTSGEL